ncbi:hypothetical protein JYJ95_06690 [Corallococcus exiguus]|uniref:hypothetical protein n=1 Tax=Corallococcus exiguus TaxID=83462 RepID=UPI001A8E266E|nr:hypothetical protein [Corallococcus exiguus]MBN8466192.1 hypothetical protein [Corallococcus exiguus]
MAVMTEFGYIWPTRPFETGLSREGYEQIRLMIEAVQTKRRDIDWPAKVVVKWSTYDLAPRRPDEVAVELYFFDEADPNQLPLVQLQFAFPKKGLSDFSIEKHVGSVMKM